jgi:hypothetical protein
MKLKIGSFTLTIGREAPPAPPRPKEEAGPAVRHEPYAHPGLKMARQLAEREGWRELWHRDNELRVRFKRGPDTYIDVWYTKMTVGTVVSHPKGRGQLFRKNVSKAMLSEIFKNPRTHTGEGYKQ